MTPELLSGLDCQLVVQNPAYSGPETEIANRLTELDLPTTPRLIRTWRANGWVVPADVRAQGYAKAPEWSNPPEAFEQARRVAEVRGGKRTNPHRIVLRLFARDHHPLPLDQVKAALRWGLAPTKKEIAEAQTLAATDADRTTAEILGEMATKQAQSSRLIRQLLRMAPSSGGSAAAHVSSSMSMIAAGLVGDDLSPFDRGGDDPVEELTKLSGRLGFIEDRVGTSGPIVTGGMDELRGDLLEFLEHASIDEIELELEGASYEDLAQCRDSLRFVFELGKLFASNIHRTEPSLPNAFGLNLLRYLDLDEETISMFSLLLLPQVRRIGASTVTQSVAQLTPEIGRQEAVRNLLDSCPSHLRRYLGALSAERLARATDHERSELTRFLDEFEKQYPGQLELTVRKDS